MESNELVLKAINFISKLTKKPLVPYGSTYVIPSYISYSKYEFNFELEDGHDVSIVYFPDEGVTRVFYTYYEKIEKRYKLGNVIPVYLTGGFTFTTNIKEYPCEKWDNRFDIEYGVIYCITPPESFGGFTLEPNYFYFLDVIHFSLYSDNEEYYVLKAEDGVLTMRYKNKDFKSVERMIRGTPSETVETEVRYSKLWFYATPEKFYFKVE